MYIDLYHHIVPHLSLNIVRRLVGLNCALTKFLFSEHLWRVVCEKQFALLHDTIPSYRVYWIVRTSKFSGKLYHYTSGELVSSETIRWYDQIGELEREHNRLYKRLIYLTRNGSLCNVRQR